MGPSIGTNTRSPQAETTKRDESDGENRGEQIPKWWCRADADSKREWKRTASKAGELAQIPNLYPKPGSRRCIAINRSITQTQNIKTLRPRQHIKTKVHPVFCRI